MFRILLVSSLLLLLTGCANSSTVITGTVAEAIDFREVKVFYNTAPDCEFEVIAYIKIPGEYYSQASIIDSFRQQAAAIGAPEVHISYLQQIGANEYLGSARAIRCTHL